MVLSNLLLLNDMDLQIASVDSDQVILRRESFDPAGDDLKTSD